MNWIPVKMPVKYFDFTVKRHLTIFEMAIFWHSHTKDRMRENPLLQMLPNNFKTLKYTMILCLSIDNMVYLSMSTSTLLWNLKTPKMTLTLNLFNKTKMKERKKNNFCGFYVICCLRIFITKNWKGITLWLLREKLFFDIVKMSQ